MFFQINPPEVYTQDFYELPGIHRKTISSIFHNRAEDCSVENMLPECEEMETEEGTLNGLSDGSVSYDGHSTDNTICSEINIQLNGKNGSQYMRHGAFCLSTQNYSDAVNNHNFPNTIQCPGQMYCHEIVYKFSLHMPPRRPIAEEEEDEELLLDEQHEEHFELNNY